MLHDGRGLIPCRGKTFMVYETSKMAEATQPSILWGKETLSPGVKRPGVNLTHSPPSTAEERNVFSFN
jgi:hypothetical protein